MSIEAEGVVPGVISTRNGVPPEGWEASDPPGGVPRVPDPMSAPHPAPTEGGEPEPQDDELPNEPPKVPPHHEAKRSHHKAK